MAWTYVVRIKERNGNVNLTATQLDILKRAAWSGRYDKLPHGATWFLKKKIVKATGWENQATTAILCRFAYKHKLLPL